MGGEAVQSVARSVASQGGVRRRRWTNPRRGVDKAGINANDPTLDFLKEGSSINQ